MQPKRFCIHRNKLNLPKKVNAQLWKKTSARVVEELFPWNTPKIEAALLYCMNMLAYYINKKWHLQNKYFPHKQEKCFYWAKGPRFNTPSLVSTKNTGIRFASIIPYPDHTLIGAVSVYCHIKKKKYPMQSPTNTHH